MSSVIRQKGEPQNEGNKKIKQAKFSKKRTFLTPRYAHVHSCYLRFEIRSFALLPTMCKKKQN